MTNHEATYRILERMVSRFESPEHFYAYMVANSEDIHAKTGLRPYMLDGVLHVSMADYQPSEAALAFTEEGS